MNKYSVIIPTLWKSNRTEQLIRDLNECDFVDEIIIIDNTNTDEWDRTYRKIRTVSKGENIYVNPAWNWGIELAKNECIALLNDDINFDPNIFGIIDKNVLDTFGIIGMGEGNYKTPIDEERGPYLDVWQPGVNDWGWGCFIMFAKKHWVDIPEQLKIWYGDNYMQAVAYGRGIPVSQFRGLSMGDSDMSVTSDDMSVRDVRDNDTIEWHKILNNGK